MNVKTCVGAYPRWTWKRVSGRTQDERENVCRGVPKMNVKTCVGAYPRWTWKRRNLWTSYYVCSLLRWCPPSLLDRDTARHSIATGSPQWVSLRYCNPWNVTRKIVSIWTPVIVSLSIGQHYNWKTYLLNQNVLQNNINYKTTTITILKWKWNINAWIHSFVEIFNYLYLVASFIITYFINLSLT